MYSEWLRFQKDSAMMKLVAWNVENEEWEAEEEIGAMGQHWVLLLLFPFIQGSFQKMNVVPKFLLKDFGSQYTYTTHLSGSTLSFLCIQLVPTSWSQK